MSSGVLYIDRKGRVVYRPDRSRLWNDEPREGEVSVTLELDDPMWEMRHKDPYASPVDDILPLLNPADYELVKSEAEAMALLGAPAKWKGRRVKK